jgi:hypothetical protein
MMMSPCIGPPIRRNGIGFAAKRAETWAAETVSKEVKVAKQIGAREAARGSPGCRSWRQIST